MSNIGLIVALRTEIPHFLKENEGIYRSGAHAVKVAVSGIGPQRARRATQQMCNGSLGFYPELLLNLGFCGAVRDDLDIGQLVIAGRLFFRDQEIVPAQAAVAGVVGLLTGTNYRIGKLQMFNWPVLSRSKVSSDTLAVDMESFAVAHTAAKYRIPAVHIKAVSDRVPQHVSLRRLLAAIRSFKSGTKKAKRQLDTLAQKMLDDQWLSDVIRVLHLEDAVRKETAP
jgi:nucleoside phosphorylase